MLKKKKTNHFRTTPGFALTSSVRPKIHLGKKKKHSKIFSDAKLSCETNKSCAHKIRPKKERFELSIIKLLESVHRSVVVLSNQIKTYYFVRFVLSQQPKSSKNSLFRKNADNKKKNGEIKSDETARPLSLTSFRA